MLSDDTVGAPNIALARALRGRRIERVGRIVRASRPAQVSLFPFKVLVEAG